MTGRNLLVKDGYEAALRNGSLRGDRLTFPGRHAAIVRGRGLSRRADSRDARELHHERRQNGISEALHHLQPKHTVYPPQYGKSISHK